MPVTPEMYLKFAKDIEPSIFENKTPKIHLDLINFINSEGRYKAAAVFRGAGKTTLLNKIYVISRLFFEKEPFILIASSVEEKALSFLTAIKDGIDNAINKGYALSHGKIWNKDKIEIIINEGKKELEKSCYISVISAGQDPRGAIIKNTRPTLIICDDLESHSGQFGVSSRANRQKLRRWFYADLLPALHPTRGKFIIIGTILHDDSILNNIIHPKPDDENGIEWQTIKFPIIKDGKSAWKSRFEIKKINQIKQTLISQGLDNEFYQEYMCAAIDPSKVLFKYEFFRYFDGIEYDISKPPTTLLVTDSVNSSQIKTRLAKSINLVGEVVDLRRCRVISTIDLASATGADETAIVTSAIDEKNRIFILDIISGHWTPFEKSVEIIKVFLSFNPERIGIEKAGMQNDFFYTIDVIQKATGVVLPVEALTHRGKAKNTRISNLEPYYRTGQIYHNNAQNSTAELEAQLSTFDPEVESKRDDIMDAFAYILEYVAGRNFDYVDSDEFFDECEADEWV
ncbi:hypothetical protein [Campylobacter gastrosuis]|uniref:Terminase large subunit gp17-like C-terminal domain-containing protein n=1 Tax=Campylobacter gastrosuis TaxID=2974576 RepID=A0ABT7HSU4_9BACT|nr:hypothetical protein [Campylobacter gastrosuis]MDL0089863.1 hypothetical protein [Campylobacter gastrosuis]